MYNKSNVLMKCLQRQFKSFQLNGKRVETSVSTMISSRATLCPFFTSSRPCLEGRGRILVQVIDGHLDQSEAYDIS